MYTRDGEQEMPSGGEAGGWVSERVIERAHLGFDVVLFQRLNAQMLLENGACSNDSNMTDQTVDHRVE